MSCFANKIYRKSGCFAVVFGIVVFCSMPVHAQSEFDELRGSYSFIYDSTYIWPDNSGGYNYIRKFVSEVELSERGRDILSRPATPILDRNDRIEISAYTILPSGDTIVVETSDIVTQSYSDNSRRVFVNFRQPEPGATLHLEWILESEKGSTSGKRFLGRTIPVEESKVVLTAPETWVFNFAVDPTCQVHFGKSIFKNTGDLPLVNYSWEAHRISALKFEEFSPPVNRIIPALYFSLSLDVSWDNPDEQTMTWSRIASIYFQQFSKFLEHSSSTASIADSIRMVAANARDAAKLAFDWIKANFHSVDIDIGLDRNLDETLERGRGTQAEAAAILYSLLKRLEISCSPYLAASRSIGEPLAELPALFWFDRILVACDFGSERVWLEPLYPISEMGTLPFEDQSIPVLRLDLPSESFEYTPDIDYHQNGKAIHLKLDIDSSGTLYGEATEIYTGAMIPEISSYVIGLDEGQKRIPWEKKLAKSFPGVRLQGFVALPPDSTGEAYRIGYTFTTGPIIRPFATRAYIPMDLLGRWEDLPILPQGDRVLPIELGRPRFEFERITLNISPAFSIEFTPKNYSLDSFIGEVYSVARKGENVVTITRGFGLKNPTLPATSYKSLVRFFNSARAEADKQIILTRRN